MNTVENFTIYLQLTYYRCVGNCNNLNDLSNNVCVSNKTEDLNLSVFKMITGVNKSKTLQSISQANLNVDLMEENVTQINGGITINVDASVKDIIYLKKIIFGILLHVIVKMQNI